MQCTRFDRLIIVKYISAGVHTRPQRSMALSRTRFSGRVLARTARPLFLANGIRGQLMPLGVLQTPLRKTDAQFPSTRLHRSLNLRAFDDAEIAFCARAECLKRFLVSLAFGQTVLKRRERCAASPPVAPQ